jgi:DNA-binding LytR/AlgR family response regulator
MKLKCVAIDDEPLALDIIQTYVSKLPYLQLVASFNNPLEAIKTIKEEGIDLLFLDINMPDMTGLDFVRTMVSPPKIILVTAYNHYALEGFEVNAVDYLLKPFSFDRFLIAVEKVYSRMLSPKNEIDFIFVKSEHNVLKVALSTIQYIEGYKDYLKIFTSEAKPILTITTIKAMEAILPDYFLRVHKSYIISINKIISYRNAKVLVKDKYIPIGDSYREIFERATSRHRL